MVETQPLSQGRVRATFSIPAIEGADSVFLVGEFNSWSETATPMSRRPDGSWAATVELKAGSRYQYRFLDDKGRWHDDPSPRARVPNPFGGENSILDLTGPAKQDAKETRKRRR